MPPSSRVALINRSHTSPPVRPESYGAVVDDRVAPPIAARITRLGYPDSFNAIRWSLEEGFDAATGESIAFPTEIRIPHRTSAQIAAMTDEERDAFVAAKGARIAWCRKHWMRVPAWGGRATPGGEYRYSAARCAAWFVRSIGADDAR